MNYDKLHFKMLVAFFLVLLSCNVFGSKNNNLNYPPPTGTGTIVGVVIERETLIPIVGALVTASCELGAFYSYSGAGGVYVIEGVEECTYTITCEAVGYIDESIYGVFVMQHQTIEVNFRMTGKMTLYPNKDASILSCTRTTNYGSYEFLTAQKETIGSTTCLIRSLIEFDLSQLPQELVVTNATLTLSGIDHQGANQTEIRRITEAWGEIQVTWDDQPFATGQQMQYLQQSSAPNEDYTIDVTWFIQNWQSGNYENNGLMLQLYDEDGADAQMVFASSDHVQSNLRPVLIINYDEPEELLPNLEDVDKNWIQTTAYDGNGLPVGQGRTYYDAFGKKKQSQVKSYSGNDLLVSQVIYDALGRGVLSTLAVPVGQNNLSYIENFITNPSDEDYSYLDFDEPTTLNDPLPVNPNCPLGAYYSDNNAEEPYVHASEFPYTRIEYSKLQPGSIRRSALASEQLRMGRGHETQTYTLSATIDELPGYGNEVLYKNYDKLIKTVAVDANGVARLSYYDPAGNLLTSCMTGNDADPGLAPVEFDLFFTPNINNPYIDILITEGSNSFEFLTDPGGRTMYVYDLTTDDVIAYLDFGISVCYLDPGYYRLQVNGIIEEEDVELVKVHQAEYYYDFACFYYDKAGRLIKEIPPVGSCNDFMESDYEYNAAGWLLSSTVPDAGYSEFIYCTDGKIRFSQNAKQRESGTGRFSYTNYDQAGRIVEVGEYIDNTQDPLVFHHQYATPGTGSVMNIIENIHSFSDPLADGLDDNLCFDQSFTLYDLPDENLALETQLPQKYRSQKFVRGRVSKSWNEEVSSWYSYDQQGRVEWMVQYFQDLEFKTLCYEYDFNGNVTKVIYQEDDLDDLFEHIYTYDADKRLKEVHTRRYNVSFYDERKQAEYSYYSHGPLKRVELASTEYGNLQGIDYIYNINGWLKSINNPGLDILSPGGKPLDPGKDFSDVFGMTLDYYCQDYERSNTMINYCPSIASFYNGNISSMRWVIKDQATSTSLPGPAGPYHWAYTFGYDKHDWLTHAKFGAFSVDYDLNNQLPNMAEQYRWDFYPVTGYRVDLAYDANGNILSLQRKGDDNAPDMDALTYQYDWINPADPDEGLKSNRLYHVNDQVQNSIYDDDIEDQGVFNTNNIPANNNYRYNAIGQMTASIIDGMYYDYDIYEKVVGIYNDVAHTSAYAHYAYDDRGFRYKKVVYLPSEDVTTYYVRDASGNIISIYESSGPPSGNPGGGLLPSEVPIYGSSRIGCYDAGLGSYNYELNDHLGNVRALVRWDEQEHKPEILNHSDYYPYGSLMPGRLMVSDNYRFGYQGQFAEKDEETGFDHFELRQWDGRLGRWMTTDPAGQFWSSYLGMGNSPVCRFDINGGVTPGFISGSGKFFWTDYIFSDFAMSGETWTKFTDDLGFFMQVANGTWLSEAVIKPTFLNRVGDFFINTIKKLPRLAFNPSGGIHFISSKGGFNKSRTVIDDSGVLTVDAGLLVDVFSASMGGALNGGGSQILFHLNGMNRLTVANDYGVALSEGFGGLKGNDNIALNTNPQQNDIFKTYSQGLRYHPNPRFKRFDSIKNIDQKWQFCWKNGRGYLYTNVNGRYWGLTLNGDTGDTIRP